MTPERIAELRAAGVLTRRGPLTQADEARIALLDIYEKQRRWRYRDVERMAPEIAAVLLPGDLPPREEAVAEVILGYLDRFFCKTATGGALRWAREQARRRP